MAGAGAMTLDCDVQVRLGGFRLSASLTADDGEVIALVGPNGTGKSTLLRALAGLTPMTGSVKVDGHELVAMPPEDRNVGWVPQTGALFPHLSAQDNVAYGLGGRPARAAARAWLDRLGIGELAHRKPAQLSGGQGQKVALARALARRPRLLLLDEPLTALDVTARVDVRRALRTHLADYDGVTVIVTHDAVDAVAVAERVVALDAGAVVQDATPAEVTRAPRTPWLAQLMGANAFPGRVSGATLLVDGGGTVALAEPAESGRPALGVVPAHAVSLHRERPGGSARNAWQVVIRELIPAGARIRVQCDGRPPVVAEVTTEAVADLRLREDDQVWASVKATEVTVVLL
jgi:molybdate transport system ATP-binding protein/molybdate transport system permease protein